MGYKMLHLEDFQREFPGSWKEMPIEERWREANYMVTGEVDICLETDQHPAHPYDDIFCTAVTKGIPFVVYDNGGYYECLIREPGAGWTEITEIVNKGGYPFYQEAIILLLKNQDALVEVLPDEYPTNKCHVCGLLGGH